MTKKLEEGGGLNEEGIAGSAIIPEIQETTRREEMEVLKRIPSLQEIRDAFDEIFLGGGEELSTKNQKVCNAMGIGDFVKIYLRSKENGFAHSRKILKDLSQLSFQVYQNLDNLPLQKRVILPEQDGNYKFLIANKSRLREMFKVTKFLAEQHDTSDINYVKEIEEIEKNLRETNIITFMCTGDTMHKYMAKKLGVEESQGVSIFGGAWIEIKRGEKKLRIHDESRDYGSCSNELIEWILQDYITKGYEVQIDMEGQRKFKDYDFSDYS